MAISNIGNEVYKFIVPFWGFRLGILLGSVRINEHVEVHAQTHLLQTVLESIQVREIYLVNTP